MHDAKAPRHVEAEPVKGGWASFWSLIVLQTQNAFNINLAKFMLIPLGAWLAAKSGGTNHTEHILSALLVAPYIFLASIAGWVGDRFVKTSVIRACSWAQVAILALLYFSVLQQSLVPGICCYGLFALQACLLSPAKIGVVKDLVGSRKLTSASGIMEMTVILGILAGQIYAGRLFDSRLAQTNDGWLASKTPFLILLGTSLIPLLLSYQMVKTPVVNKEPFRMQLFFNQGSQLKRIFADRHLRFGALGSAYFWGFAGFLNLICIATAKELSGGGQGMGSHLSTLMIAASGGIALGSGVAGFLSRKKLDLRVVALGAVILPAATLLLATTDGGSHAFKACLSIAGAGAAFIVVPLTALLQDESPADQRGSVIAGSNLLNNFGGLLAVGVQLAMNLAKLSIQTQLYISVVIAVLMAIYLIQKTRQHLRKGAGSR